MNEKIETLLKEVHAGISHERFEEIYNEYNRLVCTTRLEVSEKISAARELGDLANNPEYDKAKEWQRAVEDEIAGYRKALNEAKVIS